jgi:hypothetical protein
MLHLRVIVKRVIKNKERTRKEQCDKLRKRGNFSFSHNLELTIKNLRKLLTPYIRLKQLFISNQNI